MTRRCDCGHRPAKHARADLPDWRDVPAVAQALLERRPDLADLPMVGARVAAGWAEGA